VSAADLVGVLYRPAKKTHFASITLSLKAIVIMRIAIQAIKELPLLQCALVYALWYSSDRESFRQVRNGMIFDLENADGRIPADKKK